MAEDKKSIFKFLDKFGIESPFGDWKLTPPIDESPEGSGLQVTKVEGPFNDEGKKVEFVSREHDYYYLATLNQKVTPALIKNVKWEVSYDAGKAKDAFYLFSAGHVEKNKVKVAVQISKGVDSFSIYAYTGKTPNDNVSALAKFKKVVVFFIGGAGDKESYYGYGPTNIMDREVKRHFDFAFNSVDYSSHYLGYAEIFKMKEIEKNVLSEIKEYSGTHISVVGHSLGGWNGAHLTAILDNMGYRVNTLITLDPVGTKPGVTVISDIYWKYPRPKYRHWINVNSDPTEPDGNDAVAWAGGRWIPKERENQILHEANLHHGQAGSMFLEQVWNSLTSSDFLRLYNELYLREP